MVFLFDHYGENVLYLVTLEGILYRTWFVHKLLNWILAYRYLVWVTCGSIYLYDHKLKLSIDPPVKTTRNCKTLCTKLRLYHDNTLKSTTYKVEGESVEIEILAIASS